MQRHKEAISVNLYGAWSDFLGSLRCWRIFYIMGIGDIRKRYARSKIGQFWLTISLVINVMSIGVIWSYLFKLPMSEYLPFLAIGTIFWQYILSTMNDGTSLYIGFGSYIKELNIPKLTYLNGVIVKNIIILGHNLLVLIPVSLICWMPVSASGIIWSLFGFLLTSLFLFPVIIILALVGLRFRDVPNIINSLMQIVFYITPIMWKVRLIPEQYHYLLIFNPFAVFISICRDPLLMTDIPDYYLFAAIIYTLFAWIIGFLLFGRFRTRIVYWL